MAESGTVHLNGAVINNAVIKAQSGATLNIASNVTGTGSLVADGGHLNITGSVAGTQAITIDGAGVVHLAQIRERRISPSTAPACWCSTTRRRAA